MPTIEKVSEDARGEIYVINLPDDQELVLLHSKQGSLRGGHAHTCDEIVVMLTGNMAYHKKDDVQGKEWTDMVKGGEGSFNHAGVIHMGEFLSDSWLIEYKLGTRKGAWRNENYDPWRERVNAAV